jgi:tetratricopeptide (TPR) repeat protein
MKLLLQKKIFFIINKKKYNSIAKAYEYYSQKKYKEAEELLLNEAENIKVDIDSTDKNALINIPNNKIRKASIYNNLGLIFSERGKENFEKAINYFNSSLIYDPFNSLTYSNIGVLYHRNNNFKKAEENFDKSLELDTNNVDARYQRAILYKNEKKYAKAIGNLFF